MTHIHPHWQSTDGDDVPVHMKGEERRDSSHKHSAKQNAETTVSRMPAAIAGVSIFLVIGFFWMGGLSNVHSLLGQNAPLNTVNITSVGANPASVTVSPGMTITWTNNDTIPHVLASDTLPTQDGQTFLTTAIFPGTSTQYTVPATATAGTYQYISKTSQTVTGFIVITATGSAGASVQSAASQQRQIRSALSSSSSAKGGVTLVESSSSSTPVAVSSTATSSAPSGQLGANILPKNTHTVGTASQQPPQSAPAYAQTESHPFSAPKTGPDVMIVIIMSVAAVLCISRKAFATIA